MRRRAPCAGDSAFLAALYLDARPDLGALPVPRSVIEGIARHQQQMQRDDYARRYPAAETWVLEHEGVAVGRLVLERSGPMARVVDLSVARAARRRGIARQALRALQDECTALALRVRADNGAARALYASLGFTLQHSSDGALELAWRAPDMEAARRTGS